jgi:hypothetical protein
LPFKLFLKRIATFANAAFTHYGHTYLAKAAEISRITEWFYTANVLAMAASKGRKFGNLAIRSS